MKENLNKYVFAVILFIAIGLGIILLWPFLTTIIISGALSIVLYPIYAWFYRRCKIAWLASLITLLSFIVVLCVPLFFAAATIAKQSHSLFEWVSSKEAVDGLLHQATAYVSQFYPVNAETLQAKLAEIISGITASAGSIVVGTLSGFGTFLLILLSMFYFLKDGKSWKNQITQLSPLSSDSDQKIITKMRAAINGIFRGNLVVGVAQGVLMTIGFLIFGVPHAALWGLVTAFVSLIPNIGSGLVSIPAVIFLFSIGRSEAAIGLLIWALLFVGTIDNVLKPLAIGSSTEIHPLLVMFAILGGVILMGAVGIFIGPLIISFIYALTSVYKSEMS